MVEKMKNETYANEALNRTLIIRVQPNILSFIEMSAKERGISKSLIARQLLELGKRHYNGKFLVR